MNKIIALACMINLGCLMLAGCGPSLTPAQQEVVQRMEMTNFAQHLIYVKDSRTNMCYATSSQVTSGGHAVTAFAQIPCTSEVLNLIK